jgi:hypothetical protein
MRAITVTAFGDPSRLQLTTTADPVPAAGECLIATEACDVLFLDTMLRSDPAPKGMAPVLPWIPGVRQDPPAAITVTNIAAAGAISPGLEPPGVAIDTLML